MWGCAVCVRSREVACFVSQPTPGLLNHQLWVPCSRIGHSQVPTTSSPDVSGCNIPRPRPNMETSNCHAGLGQSDLSNYCFGGAPPHPSRCFPPMHIRYSSLLVLCTWPSESILENRSNDTACASIADDDGVGVAKPMVK